MSQPPPPQYPPPQQPPGAYPPQQQGYPPVPPAMPPQALGYATPQTLGYASPMTGVANAAWRQGNQLVTTREVDLGDACVKCGAPAEGWRWNKTLYWMSPVFILLIFLPFGLLILLIVYLIVRKSARVSAGLCPVHRKRRFNGVLITTLLVLGGLVALFAGIAISSESKSSDPPTGVIILLAGIAMLFASAVTGTTMARVLAPRKIDDRYAWFRGAGEGYLQTLNVIP